MWERERESDAHKEGFTWQLHRKLFWREKPDWRLTSGSQRRRKGEGCGTCFVPFLYEFIWEGERRDAFWRSDFPLFLISIRVWRLSCGRDRGVSRIAFSLLFLRCGLRAVRAPSHRWFIEPRNKGAHNLEASLRLCYLGLICCILLWRLRLCFLMSSSGWKTPTLAEHLFSSFLFGCSI